MNNTGNFNEIHMINYYFYVQKQLTEHIFYLFNVNKFASI